MMAIMMVVWVCREWLGRRVKRMIQETQFVGVGVVWHLGNDL